MTTWEFAKKGNQRERNPVQDEFFNAPDTLTDVSALVRESIQNSLDARLDDSKPVRVVFTLGHKESGSGHNRYFDGLQGHLDAVFGEDKSVNLGSLQEQSRVTQATYTLFTSKERAARETANVANGALGKSFFHECPQPKASLLSLPGAPKTLPTVGQIFVLANQY